MPETPHHTLARPEVGSGALLSALGEGVLRIDADGRVSDLNPAAERLTGWRRGEAVGRLARHVYRLAEEEAPGGVEPRERTLLRRDGGAVEIRERTVEIPDGNGSAAGRWVIFEDLTEVGLLRRERRRLELYDAVTGVLSCGELERRLEAAIGSARDDGGRHAFGYVDVDDLEVVRDTFGQVAADELLRQIADLVRPLVEEGGAVGRVATDRFGVLLAECRPAEVELRAESIRRSVAAFRFRWQQETFQVGVSIGLVPVGGTCGGLVEVLGAADAATDLAKDDAFEIHHFNAQSSGDVRLAEHFGEMRWLSRIHRALRKDRLRLYRQPIVPVAAPRPQAAELHEVLIRMLGEDDAVVEPGAFIPAAERFHLIASLDRWVVETALARLEAESPGSRRSGITLNLSGQSLSEGSFLDFVLAQLEARSVAPSEVCFEITETAAVRNLERARSFLSTLHRRGCRFILDDFGSGLSSFAYLKNLPVDYLKIDGDFVRNMLHDPIQHAIVRSIHQIGHVMGLKTIAEAVESEETLAALADLGVDYAQGFWVRRPEPWA